MNNIGTNDLVDEPATPAVAVQSPEPTTKTSDAMSQPPEAARSAEPATNATRSSAEGPYWAWVGVHGGAGVTTLAEAIPGGIDLGRDAPWEVGMGDLPTVAVCRPTFRGLSSAREFAKRANGHTAMLGLVVVGDMPERKRPKVLAESLYVTRGAFNNHVWEMPFVDRWRLGEPPSKVNNPQQVRDLLRTLWTAVNLPLPGGTQQRSKS